MRVLLFHGYLLRGTGSNVYTANLAAALVNLGHEVHLLCQERHASELEFVGAVGDWDSGELQVKRVRDASCTVYRPNIGRILPVYVQDRYEALEARLFAELTEGELDAYLEANVRAVQDVVARANPGVALANHLVMAPAILARALTGTSTPYAVKIHGSALEYTVKPHPRFLPYAREGLDHARTVLVGSRHVAESLWAALEDDTLPERTRLGPPGVDAHSFRPRAHNDAVARVRTVARQLSTQTRGISAEPGSAFARDDRAAAEALIEAADRAGSGPLVAFVGKLLVAKGIDLLLAAWPLVLEQVPSARLLVIGFGAYRRGVEQLVDALSGGDLGAIRKLVDTDGLTMLGDFLDGLEAGGGGDRYFAAARAMRERVILTGRLEHDELAEVLPLCEAIVVPSTFPESFGMVAVEAAACGALPISAGHSGLIEVSRALARELPEPLRELASFPLGPGAVEAIAGRLTRWLQTPPSLRAAARKALVETVGAHYSWEGVARRVIAAARGELEALDPVS